MHLHLASTGLLDYAIGSSFTMLIPPSSSDSDGGYDSDDGVIIDRPDLIGASSQSISWATPLCEFDLPVGSNTPTTVNLMCCANPFVT